MGFLAIAKFLLRNWRLVSLVLALAGVFGYRQYLVHTISSQKDTIATQQQQITSLQSTLEEAKKANTDLQGLVSKQNQALDELHSVQKSNEHRIAVLNDIIRKERKQSKQTIDDLRKKPLAKTCNDAIDELRNAPSTFTPLDPPALDGVKPQPNAPTGPLSQYFGPLLKEKIHVW